VHSYACALHSSTLQLLDQLGLASDVIARGFRVDRMAFYEGAARQGEVRLSDLGGDYPYMVVLPQSDFEDLLEQRLATSHDLRVNWDHRFARMELAGGRTVAHVDRMGDTSQGYPIAHLERTVERSSLAHASYVVAADGQDSLVRRQLGIEVQTVGEPEFFEVYEVELDRQLENEVRVVFSENTLNVLWPLPSRRCRWSFQVPAGMASEGRIKDRLAVRFVQDTEDPATLDRLRSLIASRAPWFKHSFDHLEWSIDIHFQKRLARDFGRDFTFLVGDSAHQTGPVGMQSMNLGMREAGDLAQRITRALREGGGPTALADYSRKWHGEWEQLLGINGGLRPREDAPGWVKNRAAAIAECLPATGADFLKLAAQISLKPS
jgi:2-polyprenyl-6-methoxyphenol hydroxylase-like FAD-dependent oxidoreductase